MSGDLKPRRFGVGKGETAATAQPSYDDEAFRKKYPLLAEFMQREWWSTDESTPIAERHREKGTLVLFCEEGQFKLCLSDKDGECVAFVSKKAFQSLLEAAEKGLRDDTHDWRLTAAGKQKRRK